MKGRGRLVITTLLTLSACTGAAAPRTPAGVTPARSHEKIVATEPAAAVDFYGNQVSPAIARYKIDAAGALYEEHSPETELPRLGSPKS
jgi:hypothetical protein